MAPTKGPFMRRDFSTRPPKILIHPGSAVAPGTYRLVQPALALAEQGLAIVNVEHRFRTPEGLKLLNPDVIIVQVHQFSDEHLHWLRLYKQSLPSAHFVYEIDDLFWEVPATNPCASGIPADIKKRIAAAASLCDAIVCSTEELARAIRKDLPGVRKPVVLPNFITQSFVDKAAEGRRVARNARPEGDRKPRVGWAGGITHAVELGTLVETIRATADAVQWVFMGQAPAGVENLVETHSAVDFDAYPEALGRLDLDLAIAPFGTTRFDNCKTPLRILELAAAGYPVVSNFPGDTAGMLSFLPYNNGEAASDALAATIRFVASDPKVLNALAHTHHERVVLQHLLERNTRRVIEAWLPRNAKPFEPGAVETDNAKLIIARPGVDTSGLVEAVACYGQPSIASYSALSNDGGYPVRAQFTPLNADQARDIAEEAAAAAGDNLLPATFPHGPAIVLNPNAIARVGPPDYDRYGDAELALADWGARALRAGFAHAIVPQAFIAVAEAKPFAPNAQRALTEVMQWHPVLSEFAAETAKSPVSAEVFRRMDIALAKRTFWAPPTATYAERHDLHDGDSPFRRAAAADLDIGNVVGDWVLYPPAAECVPDVLDEIARAARDNPGAVLIYGDHDHVGADGAIDRPFFKPDFNYELLLGLDYVSPVVAFKRDRLLALTGPGYADKADLDLVLRFIEANAWTPAGGPDHSKIAHVARSLRHLPADVPVPDNRGAVLAHLSRTGQSAAVSPGPVPGSLQVRFLSDQAARVRIVISSACERSVLAPVISEILRRTAYPNFDVAVVYDGPLTGAPFEWTASAFTVGDRVHFYTPNTQLLPAALLDFGAGGLTGLLEPDLLVFLSDQAEIVSSTWLSDLVGLAMRPGVGAVGAKLLNADTREMAGGPVLVNPNPWDRDLALDAFAGIPGDHPGPFGRAALTAEWQAAGGLLLAVPAMVYRAVGGFTEALPVRGADVDLCLRLRDLGLRTIVSGTPAALVRAAAFTPYPPLVDILCERPAEPDVGGNLNLRFAPWLILPEVAPVRDWLLGYEQPRILLVNGSVETAREHYKNGRLAYLAEIAGDHLKIVGPEMPNVAGVDLGAQPDEAADLMAALGASAIEVVAPGPISVGALFGLAALKQSGIDVRLPAGFLEAVSEHLPKVWTSNA